MYFFPPEIPRRGAWGEGGGYGSGVERVTRVIPPPLLGLAPWGSWVHGLYFLFCKKGAIHSCLMLERWQIRGASACLPAYPLPRVAALEMGP